MLKIYNTLTGKKEEFKPLNYPYVNMYTCGVTIYDDCHIGHGRSLFIFETVRRFLLYKGYKVEFVRNITDVDDKMINKARQWSEQSGAPLIDSFNEVRERYMKSYYRDLKALSVPEADIEPLATENIPQMVDFIKILIKKGFAYQKDGSVYFRIRKFNNYGRLSGRKIDDLFSGVRITPDPFKEDPLDFALWKGEKENEPSWDSPFGRGRPGWHIECSVMANRFLGKTLDIHGGGKDLIFPHHENEIAQSEALSGRQFSRFWMHHGLLTIEGRKMSKSLGNFITLGEAIKEYSSSILKIVYLSSHYRSPLDFSKDRVQEAKRVKDRIITFIKQLNSRGGEMPLPDYKNVREEAFSYTDVRELYRKFIEFMDDDFNMPGGFSVIFDIIGVVNNNLDKDAEFFYEAKILTYLILSLLVMEDMFNESGEVAASYKDYIEEKISLRNKLRKERKFSKADEIRGELKEKGIVLEDQSDGKTIWYKQ